MPHHLLSIRSDRAILAGTRSRWGHRRRCAFTVLLLLSGTFAAPADAAEQRTVNDTNVLETTHTDWMRAIPDGTSLTDLSIPGAHDACTGQGLYALQVISKTQGLDLANQLIAGYRAWDIRFRFDAKNDDLITGHERYDCLMADSTQTNDKVSLDFVFKTAEAFLAAHPSETLLMKIGDAGREKYHDKATDVDVEITRLVNAYLAKYAHVVWSHSYSKFAPVPIPTLGDVRGKIVILASAPGQDGWKDGTGFREYGLYWGDQVIQSEVEIKYGQTNLQYQRARDFVRDQADPHYDKANGLYTGHDKLYVNQLNGAGKGVLYAPLDIAKGVNEPFTEYLLDNRAVKMTGVTMGDYFGGSLIDAVIAHNFRLIEPAAIAEVDADVDPMVENFAFHVDDEVGNGDNANERVSLLYDIFQYFLPGQYVHVAVSKNDNWRLYVDDNNGVRSDLETVGGYEHIMWLTENALSTVSESALQTTLDAVVKTFKGSDGGRARKDAIAAELHAKYPNSNVSVLVHPEPGGAAFWSVAGWGVLASKTDGDYIHKAILSDRSVTLTDTIAPTAAPTASPAANANGWNNKDVTISWNWTDTGGSGIDPALCDGSRLTDIEGSYTVTENCNDLAGNTGEGTYGVAIDKTIPAITAILVNAIPGPSGWHTMDVRVSFTCTDAVSGIDPAGGCPPGEALTAEGASVTSTPAVAIDLAGNVSDPSNTITVSIDKTRPTITAAALTQPNVSGWYNGDVTVGFTCTDAVSGISTDACPASQVLTGEGRIASQAVPVSDIAGNSAMSNTVAVNIDRTPPKIVASTTTPPAPSGWYRQNVTVQFACADTLSGIATGSCPADQTLDAEGAAVQSTAATVSDRADNVSAASNVVTVKIDKTAPTIVAAPLASANEAGWYRGDVLVGFTCADALSGVNPTACPATQTLRGEGVVESLPVGVRDIAGNTSAPSNVVAVQIDRTLPAISIAASLPELFPANNKMVEQTISGVAFDGRSGLDPGSFTFRVIDEYGTVQPSGAVVLGLDGSYAFQVMLEAKRLNTDPDGRTYQVIVQGSDVAGNVRASSTTVTVPRR